MTWHKIVALGVVASATALAVGCTVTAGPGSGDGGLPGEDSGTGGKTGTGGSTSTGGSSGTGGTKSTGGSAGKAGSGGSSGAKMDAGPDGAGGMVTMCSPDPTLTCDNCIETKCCNEWLDCVNDGDCINAKGEGEFPCIQVCLVAEGGTKSVAECAGSCQHGVIVSDATSALIACLRAPDGNDASTTQKCTNECFNRDLPTN